MKTVKMKNLLFALGLLVQICAAGTSDGLDADAAVDVTDAVSPQEAEAILLSMSAYSAKPQISPVYIDCFDDCSEWKDLYRLTVQDVSEFDGQKAYLCGNRHFSSTLVTTVPVAGSYNYHHMVKTFAAPRDFSYCHISCRLNLIQCKAPDGTSGIQKVSLRFIDTRDIYIDFVVSYAAGPGWQETNVTQDDYAEGNPNIDWTKIKKIAIVVFTKEDSTCNILMDRLMLFTYPSEPNGPKPVVINTFDDALLDQYDAGAYLSGKGMTGTFYIFATAIGLPGHLTLSQCRDMKFAGHLMANHTLEHRTPFDGLTPEEQVYQITKMQQWMWGNGFGDGARILATPGNVLNPQMDRVLRPYYSQVRQTLSGGGLRLNPLFDKTHLRVSANTPAVAKAQVETILRNPNPSVMVYMGHGMKDSMAEFKAYVDFLYGHLQDGHLRVCNPAELLSL